MRLLQKDARTLAVRARRGLRCVAAMGLLALLGACADRTTPMAPMPASPLSATPTAQVQTSPTLTWLAPLGTATATPETFDAQAAPVVEICASTSSACSGAIVTRFSTAVAGADLPLAVNAAAGTYEASWNLLDTRFTTRRTYRIRVLQGTTELGALSVDVVRGRWALTRTDGSVAPLVSASSLPVRFTVSAAARLTVVLGAGVEGTPAAGEMRYPAGTRINYSFGIQPGYQHLRVQVDGADAAAAGELTVSTAHTIVATADRIPVVSDQAQPVVPLARALVTATDAAEARRAADSFTTAARTLYETLGPEQARRQLAEITALAFDPVSDTAALRRATELLAAAPPLRYAAGTPAADGMSSLRSGRRGAVTSADAAVAAGARPTTLIFVNGVLNSPTSGMQALVEVDRLALEAGLLAQSGGDLQMEHFYNASWLGDPMAGPFNCLMGVGVDELSGELTRQIKGEKCSGGLLGPLEVATQYAAGLLATSRLTVPQARLLADRIHAELDIGRKVIVVAHSQGNLMAQQATRLLEETLPSPAMACIAVASVAPPVTENWPRVVWTGVYAKGERTRDILLDVIVPTPVTAMIRSNVTDAADARVNATPLGFQTLWSFYEDAKLHSMVASYMAGDGTSAQIRENLASSAATLEPQCRDSVVVTPTEPTILVGQAAALTAEVKSATGVRLAERQVTWESLTPAIATVDDGGVVTGVSAGMATIRAKSGSANTDVKVTITDGGGPPPPPPPPPDPCFSTGITMSASPATVHLGHGQACLLHSGFDEAVSWSVNGYFGFVQGLGATVTANEYPGAPSNYREPKGVFTSWLPGTYTVFAISRSRVLSGVFTGNSVIIVVPPP